LKEKANLKKHVHTMCHIAMVLEAQKTTICVSFQKKTVAKRNSLVKAKQVLWQDL
jgi:hypothetical protein